MLQNNFLRFYLIVLIGLAACTLPGAGPHGHALSTLSAGNHTLFLEHDGRSRSYIVHLPPQVDSGQKLPLVLNFHGGGGHAANQQKYAMMDNTADDKGFVVIYPNGTGRFKNRLLTWNTGKCCGYAMNEKVNDVGFVIALLDDISQKTNIDRKRVYATGLSNGAMMSYRLAVEASDHIAAIAPVAGAMMVVEFTPKRPLPVMHIHSVDDPRALYGGGLAPPFPFTNNRVNHTSVESTIEQWVVFNQCSPNPNVSETIKGRKGSEDEGHTATKYTYAPVRAEEGAAVILWKLSGAGHVWPGGKRKYFVRLLGPGTSIINANEEMWRFFSKYSLSGRNMD